MPSCGHILILPCFEEASSRPITPWVIVIERESHMGDAVPRRMLQENSPLVSELGTIIPDLKAVAKILILWLTTNFPPLAGEVGRGERECNRSREGQNRCFFPLRILAVLTTGGPNVQQGLSHTHIFHTGRASMFRGTRPCLPVSGLGLLWSDCGPCGKRMLGSRGQTQQGVFLSATSSSCSGR